MADEMDSLLASLIEKEIPDGRNALAESHKNLEVLSYYCKESYYDSSDKTKALDETKTYASQSLASVAYQIHSLAVNILQMMDQQTIQLQKMQSNANNIGLVVDIHKEKVARREIGVLTSSKNFSRSHKIVAPQQQEKTQRYKREEIDFTVLDHIGHGVKSERKGDSHRRVSTSSSTGSYKESSALSVHSSQGSLHSSLYQSISTPLDREKQLGSVSSLQPAPRPPVAPVAPYRSQNSLSPTIAPVVPIAPSVPPQHVPAAPPPPSSAIGMPPPPVFVPDRDYDEGKLGTVTPPPATSSPIPTFFPKLERNLSVIRPVSTYSEKQSNVCYNEDSASLSSKSLDNLRRSSSSTAGVRTKNRPNSSVSQQRYSFVEEISRSDKRKSSTKTVSATSLHLSGSSGLSSMLVPSVSSNSNHSPHTPPPLSLTAPPPPSLPPPIHGPNLSLCLTPSLKGKPDTSDLNKLSANCFPAPTELSTIKFTSPFKPDDSSNLPPPPPPPLPPPPPPPPPLDASLSFPKPPPPPRFEASFPPPEDLPPPLTPTGSVSRGSSCSNSRPVPSDFPGLLSPTMLPPPVDDITHIYASVKKLQEEISHLPPPPPDLANELYQIPTNNALAEDLPPPPLEAFDLESPTAAMPPPPPSLMDGNSLSGPSHGVPENYEEKVVAIYDYDKLRDDELKLAEGDIIYVIKKNDDGWFEGIKDGVQGLFPGNYVTPYM